MSVLARDGAGRRGAAQIGLRCGRMGKLPGRTAPGVGLSAGVGVRSSAKTAMATGGAAMLAAVQPAASGALLTVGGRAVRVLLAVLTGVAATDEFAVVVTRPLAGVLVGARTVARLGW
jgi:hypothetical protein